MNGLVLTHAQHILTYVQPECIDVFFKSCGKRPYNLTYINGQPDRYGGFRFMLRSVHVSCLGMSEADDSFVDCLVAFCNCAEGSFDMQLLTGLT
jgi:hypothetical protein